MRIVYFIQRDGDGPIKIGSTKRGVSQRRKELQIGSPEPLRVIGQMVGDETAVHQLFRAHLISGEWFLPHPDILQFVREHAADSKHITQRERIIGVTLKNDLLKKLKERQKEAKELTGFEPSLSAVVKALIQESAAASGES